MILSGFKYKTALATPLSWSIVDWIITLDKSLWMIQSSSHNHYDYYFCNEDDAIAFSIKFGLPVKKL